MMNKEVRMRAIRLWLILILVVSCFPIIGIGLLPAEAAVQIASPSVQAHTAAPGQSYQGTIELANPGDVPQAVRLYQTDYLYDAEGHSYFDPPGTVGRSNAAWIEIGSQTVTVPAGGRRTVVYRVDVPDDKTLEGTYWSLIMVELLPPELPATPTPGGQDDGKFSVSLRTVVRYAIQIVTEIGKTGQPVPQLKNPRLVLTEDGAQHQFQVDIANNGSRWFRPRVWMEVYDRNGSLVGRFEGGERRLYPGTSVRQRINLGALPAGEYTAILILDGGDSEVFGARYTLTVVESTETNAKK
jgi:hypothetical protein